MTLPSGLLALPNPRDPLIHLGFCQDSSLWLLVDRRHSVPSWLWVDQGLVSPGTAWGGGQ